MKEQIEKMENLLLEIVDKYEISNTDSLRLGVALQAIALSSNDESLND